MPIHDQSYRRYGGTRESARSAWSVIALTGIKNYLTRRAFLFVLFCAWFQFFIQAGRIYIAAAYPQAEQAAGALLKVTPDTYYQFLTTQGFWILVVSIYCGAGLIANDRRANALQIYLSKPLTRAQYIAGKMTILLTFLLLITLIPALLLLLLQILFEGSFAFLRAHPFVIPAIVLGSLVQSLVASFAMLALSSLSTSSRFVAILFAGIMLFTDIIYGVMRVMMGTNAVSWLSITASLRQVLDVIFRRPLSYDTPVVVSFLVLLALMAVSASVLERRVRGVEIVK